MPWPLLLLFFFPILSSSPKEIEKPAAFEKKIEAAKQRLTLFFPDALDQAMTLRVKQAESLEQDKAYDQAAKKWEELVNEDPQNASYLYRLGRVYSWLGRYEEGEYMLKRSLAINSKDADVMLALGNLYLWSKKEEKAEEIFTTILQDYPDYKDAQEGLVKIKERNQEKTRNFRKQIVEGQNKLVAIFRKLGKEREEHAIKAGEALEKEKAYGEAEKIWKYLLSKEPDSAFYLYKLGRIYAWTGRYGEAERLLNRSLSINPKDADVQLSLAYLYFWTDRDERGKELFLKILKDYPDYEDAKKGLAKIEESQREKAKEAENKLKKQEEKKKEEEKEEKPAEPEFEPWQLEWMRVAQCLEKSLNYEEALTVWHFLLESSREWPTIEYPCDPNNAVQESVVKCGANLCERRQFEKYSEKYKHFQKVFAFNMGKVLSWAGLWQRASDYLLYALSIDPKYDEAWLRLGYVALFSGQLEWSQQIFWELLATAKEKPDPDVVEAYARVSQALTNNCEARTAYSIRYKMPDPTFYILKNYFWVLHWTNPWARGTVFYSQERETDLITKVRSAQRNTFFSSFAYYLPLNERARVFAAGFAGSEREINLSARTDNFSVLEWKYGVGFDCQINPWLTLKSWCDVKEGRDIGHPIFPFGFHRRFEPGGVLTYSPPNLIASLSAIRDSFIVKNFQDFYSFFLARDTYLGQAEYGFFNNWVLAGIMGFYGFYHDHPLNRQWEGQTWATFGFPRYDSYLFFNYRGRIGGFKFTETDYYSYARQWEHFAKIYYLKMLLLNTEFEMGYHRSWQWSRDLNQPINTAIFVRRLFRITNKAYLELRHIYRPNISLTFRTEYYTDTTEYTAWSTRGEMQLIF